MTTVINTPANNGESTGLGITIGVVLVIVILLGLFFVYGLPKLNGSAPANGGVNVNVDLPSAGNTGGDGAQ